MTITNLALSYDDFVLDTIIDPDEFDANFSDIVTKINELILDLNTQFATQRIADDAITSEKIADAAVTPAKVGDFTIVEAEPTVSTAALSVLLNNLANRLSDIKGAGQVWTSGAVIDLVETKAHVDAVAPHSGHETTSGAQAKVDAHANNTDNPHTVTCAQIGAIKSVDGVQADALGDVDLVAGTGITIAPDNGAGTITITATGVAVPGAHAYLHSVNGGSDPLTPAMIGAIGLGTQGTDLNEFIALSVEADSRSVAYTYDVNGNIETEVISSGATTVQTTTYTYTDGVLTSKVVVVGTLTITYTYGYTDGNLTSTTKVVA